MHLNQQQPLKFNSIKCKYMVISRKRLPSQPNTPLTEASTSGKGPILQIPWFLDHVLFELVHAG